MISDITIRIAALLIVAVIYAAFDIFNDRNVPNVFAYAGIALGLAATLTYGQGALVYSLLVAMAVGALGHLIYRLGMWGAGDYFELVTISLLLPIQQVPALLGPGQLGLPFILSVFVATGFISIWIVPVYYMAFVRAQVPDPKISRRKVAMGLTLIALYVAVFFVASYILGLGASGLLFPLLIAVPSAVMLILEKKITARMVRLIPTRELEEGDIIAVNMMKKSEVRYFSKYRAFGRLATGRLVGELKKEKRPLPVYRNAVPLAAFIFLGTVVALLFGNLILFVI